MEYKFDIGEEVIVYKDDWEIPHISTIVNRRKFERVLNFFPEKNFYRGIEYLLSDGTIINEFDIILKNEKIPLSGAI